MFENMIIDIQMQDGREFTDIEVIYPDLIRYEDVAQRHKWGSMEQSPMRAMAFIGYAALCRLGLYDGDRGFPEFSSELKMVYKQDATEEMDPTPAGVSTAF